MTGAKVGRKIDIRGEVCPYTFVKAKLAIEDLKKGQMLEVVLDHEPAIRSVPRSMEMDGHKVLGVKKAGNNEWRILIMKS
ncbi:MAG: sulfurtransferase TusA family protein [Methanobacteriota archaeon]